MINDKIDEQTEKSIIASANELVKKLLRKGNPRFNKGNVFSLAVAKFIVVKEALIKKDIPNRTIYYDNTNEYQNKSILDIYEYIKNNGSYTRDDLNINLTKPDLNIEEAVWVINKIKDSFAHKKYKFDLKNNAIIINNQGTNYSLRCSIPLKLLQSFSLDMYNIEMYEIFNNKKYIKPEIDLKNYNYEYINDNIIDEKYEYNEKIINNKILNEYKKYLELEKLIESIKLDNKNITIDEIKTLMKFMQYFQQSESQYEEKARELIDDMMNALNVKADTKTITLFAALYNYMTLVLLDDTKKVDYRHMKTTGIFYQYTINNQATESFENIRNETNKFMEHCQKLVDVYNNHNANVSSILQNELARYYDSILDKLGIRNEALTKSIRNSYSHGNVSTKSNGAVQIYDKSDQTSEDVNFACLSRPDDLYLFASQFEKQTEFNINDFFDELREILDVDTYLNLKELMNNISLIVFGQELKSNNNMEYMFIQKTHNILLNESL